MDALKAWIRAFIKYWILGRDVSIGKWTIGFTGRSDATLKIPTCWNISHRGLEQGLRAYKLTRLSQDEAYNRMSDFPACLYTLSVLLCCLDAISPMNSIQAAHIFNNTKSIPKGWVLS